MNLRIRRAVAAASVSALVFSGGVGVANAQSSDDLGSSDNGSSFESDSLDSDSLSDGSLDSDSLGDGSLDSDSLEGGSLDGTTSVNFGSDIDGGTLVLAAAVIGAGALAAHFYFNPPM